MSELEWKPPIELWKMDHGIDGWDAKRWLVARFTARDKAVEYLIARGFTYRHNGQGDYYHKDPAHRNTMGAISYEIREVKPEVPVDPS